MSRDFSEALAFGRMGELLVSRWAQESGCGVLPCYDFSGSDGAKAPRLMFKGGGLVIPDLDLCRDGRRWWLEVKTYHGPAINRRRKCEVHGIPDRLFASYAAVEVASGTPVYLAVLELDSGTLLVASLSSLSPLSFGCQCGCLEGAGTCRAPIKRGRYWPRTSMSARHHFTSEELAPIRAAHARRSA